MLDLGKDAKGRRDRKKVTGKTRKEVADRLAEIRAKADEGLNVKANMTVGELLDEFYEEQKGYGLLTETEAADVATKVLGKRSDQGRAGRDQARPCDRSRCDEGVREPCADAGRAVTHSRAVDPRRALNLAEDRGYARKNAARTVKVPDGTKEPRVRESLSLDDMARLREYVEGTMDKADPYRSAIAIQITSGMRPGELLGLRWSDITLTDGDNATIRVEQSLVRVPRATGKGVDLVFAEPKTKKSRRALVLPEWATSVLREFAATRPARTETDLVYGSPKIEGQALEPGAYRRALRQVAKRAGTREFSPHELRRSHLSYLVASVPIELVAERAGHRDSRTTKLRYVIPLTEGDRTGLEESERLGEGQEQRVA